MSSPTIVSNAGIRRHAERLAGGPVSIGGLSTGFEESHASSAEVLVEGKAFYPRMLEDIASASSSIHINQFGFRPGAVGERFADVLVAKAKEGIPVRLVVDRQGSDPEGGSREFYERLTAAGMQVCVVRATKPRAPGGPARRPAAPLAGTSARSGTSTTARCVVVDGRIGWVGGAGIEDHFEDGRFHDLFVRVTGPVVAQLQLVFLAGFRWLGGPVPAAELDALFPGRRRAASGYPPSSCTTPPAGTGRSPTRSRASSTAQARRSTSSIPTSPTAA